MERVEERREGEWEGGRERREGRGGEGGRGAGEGEEVGAERGEGAQEGRERKEECARRLGETAEGNRVDERVVERGGTEEH